MAQVDRCPAREAAFEAAVRALAASPDGESPGAIVAGLPADPVCPAGSLEQRVRCHLARPGVAVESRCSESGWLFVVAMPELSDHVHRVRVWNGRAGALAVRLTSEN